jgi:phosphoribosylcarboxyaminoimidazole (NCAIR) mutase
VAKYDTYTLTVQIGKAEQAATLEISILFEDGDNIANVIQNARNTIKAEATAMKTSGFIASLKQ